MPRIGYVHSWARTQDEGWVRLAFDAFGVPYTYFGDTKLREGNLRASYDVIVYPHVGGTPQAHVNGLPMAGGPVPYRKTELTPNLGVQDSADDIRGGMGLEGLAHLAKFVQDGGTLIVEGSTATVLPEYGLAGGVTVEEPGEPVRAGIDPEGAVGRQEEPDRVRLRRCGAARLLQPGPGHRRRRHGRRVRRAWAAASRSRGSA